MISKVRSIPSLKSDAEGERSEKAFELWLGFGLMEVFLLRRSPFFAWLLMLMFTLIEGL